MEGRACLPPRPGTQHARGVSVSVLSASEQWHWRNVSLNKIRGMRAVCVLLYDEYLSLRVSVKSVCLHVSVGTWCVYMCVCVYVCLWAR